MTPFDLNRIVARAVENLDREIRARVQDGGCGWTKQDAALVARSAAQRANAKARADLMQPVCPCCGLEDCQDNDESVTRAQWIYEHRDEPDLEEYDPMGGEL